MQQPEPDLTLLSNQAVGEIGRLLASAEMLKRGICVYKPEQDTGVDLISHSLRGTRLLQVKAKIGKNSPSERRSVGSIFPVSSNQPGRSSRSMERYKDIGVDVFVFVRINDTAFWVVPSDSISSQWSTTMREDSEWRDAWHVLEGGPPSAA